MAKITKSEVKQIISEELERFKKIKSLEAKKASILESIEQIEEGKSENWNKLQELLDVTTKENLFDMLWNWQSGDDQEEFLEHAIDELGLSEEDEDDLDFEPELDEEMVYEAHKEETNYMFFSNLKQIHRMAEEILGMDKSAVDEILTNGHAWAVDHIATSKDDIEEVCNFLKNDLEEDSKLEYLDLEIDTEEDNLEEEKMTKSEKKKREEIVMALKDKMSEFKKRYGKRAEDVMYATATKQAMEK